MVLSPLNRDQFLWPQTDLLSAWVPELVDWWGLSVKQSFKRIVFFKGNHWFVKFKPEPEELKRDYLAYLLGRGWANVAEVCPISKTEFSDLLYLGIAKPKWAFSINCFLVRLAQDYTVGELPNTDIDSAVASELVFSLWTRRRDAHAANRAYISQIPVFFDHQTAFLGEPHLKSLDVFFQTGLDAGYAGRWRVEMAGLQTNITTMNIRQISRQREIALHVVRDIERFNKSIQTTTELLQNQSTAQWLGAAYEAGYSKTRAHEIVTFLEENCQKLGDAVEKMRSVI